MTREFKTWLHQARARAPRARAFNHAHKKTTGFEAVVLMREVLDCP